MGNPRRFFGADREIQIDDVIIPPRCAVEVTFRTHQQCHLLRPDKEAREILLGCFGRAFDRYKSDLDIYIVTALSNHGQFLALPGSEPVLSNFMRDFLSTAAKRLNPLRDRSGTFWERRFRAIPILDEESLEERFRYALTQGTKENLVWSVRDWPGISSARALMGGPPLVGRWRDHSRETTLRRQRERKLGRAAARGVELSLPRVRQVWREYPIELTPLPHWRELPVGERRARVASMIAHDDRITRERHERARTQPLGVAKVLSTPPTSRPADPAHSPAPRCHASSHARRKAFREVARAFENAIADAGERTRAWLPNARLPTNATLPPLRLPAEWCVDEPTKRGSLGDHGPPANAPPG